MHTLYLTLLGISLIANSVVTATAASRIAGRDDDIPTGNVLKLALTNHPRHQSLPVAIGKNLTRRCADSLCKRHLRQNIHPLGKAVGYHMPVEIGGTKFQLMIDTASPQTWVATSNFVCYQPRVTKHAVPQSNCDLGNLFDASPHVFKSFNQVSDITYDDKEFARGVQGTARLGLGGFGEGEAQERITIESTITAANEVGCNGFGIHSGILSLSYPTNVVLGGLAIHKSDSVLYRLFHSAGLPPILTFALDRYDASNPTSGGFLALGGIPRIPTKMDWVITPILPHPTGIGHYYIEIDGISIAPPAKYDSGENEPYISSGYEVIIDSGSTATQLPPDMVDYIASLFVPEADYDEKIRMYWVDCDAHAPRVGIKIAGTTFYMSPKDLLLHIDTGDGEDLCTLMIDPGLDNQVVLGGSWLKNVLVAFDMRKAEWTGSDGITGHLGVARIVSRMEY